MQHAAPGGEPIGEGLGIAGHPLWGCRGPEVLGSIRSRPVGGPARRQHAGGPWPSLGAQAQARSSAVAASLVRDAVRQGHRLDGVSCPAVPRIVVGRTVFCTARVDGAGSALVPVTFTSVDGRFRWRLEPSG